MITVAWSGAPNPVTRGSHAQTQPRYANGSDRGCLPHGDWHLRLPIHRSVRLPRSVLSCRLDKPLELCKLLPALWRTTGGTAVGVRATTSFRSSLIATQPKSSLADRIDFSQCTAARPTMIFTATRPNCHTHCALRRQANRGEQLSWGRMQHLPSAPARRAHRGHERCEFIGVLPR